MSELFEKSIRTLELPAVLEKLAAKAVSQAAKDRCLKLTPSTDCLLYTSPSPRDCS